jgi:hypothetical protein
MATISNTPRPGYVWDSTDNVWYPIGVGAHQHTNAADTPAVMPYSTYAAAGKNKIINGDFAINQRGFTSVTTTSTYMFDRFQSANLSGTVTYTPQTFTPGTAPVTGYEAKNFIRMDVTGQSATNSLAAVQHRIEDVRTYAGQTITVSFWAKAASGTPNIVPWFQQLPGTGGSAGNTFGGATKQAITTSWARYSFTVAVPSIAGMTIGTGDYFNILITGSAGSDRASYTDSIGIQTNTFDIWGVQVEAGSTATAFETATGNPASELAACQRYFQAFNGVEFTPIASGLAYSTTGADYSLTFPTMRTAPSASVSAAGDFYGMTGSTHITATSFVFYYSAINSILPEIGVASGFTLGQATMLKFKNTNARIYLSSEL